MLPSIKKYFSISDDQEKMITVQQADILLFIYRFGSISPMEAFSELYITKLSTRISEMKAMGIQFDQGLESRTNWRGRKVHYMRYRRAA